VVIGSLCHLVLMIGSFKLLLVLWPDYQEAYNHENLTFFMMLIRLVLSGLSLVLAGIITVVVSKNQSLSWITALVLLLIGAGTHFTIYWDDWPIWYHAAYLLPIIPVVGFSGKLVKIKT